MASNTKAAPVAPKTVPTERQFVLNRKIRSRLFKDIAVGKENAVKISGLYKKSRLRAGQQGDFTAFFGEFRLLSDNTVYIGQELILLLVLETVFAAAVAKLEPKKEGIFVAIVYKLADTANPRGYVWTMEFTKHLSVITPQNDPLIALLG